MHFPGKLSKGPRGQESGAEVRYLPMRIHPKSCRIFPLKAVTTLRSGSRKGAGGAQ